VTTEYGADSFLWPAFGLHDEFDSPSPIVALEWLGPRSLAYLAVNNEFSVVDTVMMTMLERLNFSGLRLVYAEFALSRSAPKDFESDDKGKAGRVCTTFQNTLRASDNRLLLLCQEEVRSISILGAKRRISALEEDGEWLEALALALDHYENTVKSQEDRQRVQGEKDISKHPSFILSHEQRTRNGSRSYSSGISTWLWTTHRILIGMRLPSHHSCPMDSLDWILLRVTFRCLLVSVWSSVSL
jgi:hypothetical protein